MDIQTGLVCLGVVVVSGAVIFIISMFGIKEKTYEEAIAEQRKMPEENLLLGRSGKDKVKDKKQKKAGKKVKEKPIEKEKNKQPETVPSITLQDKANADFEEPEAEDKKKKKKEKVKEEAKPAKAVAEAKPIKAVVEAKPAKSVAESKPAKAVVESKPAKVTAEVKPAKVVAESKPSKTTAETKPTKVVAESKPAKVTEAKPMPTNHFREIQPKDDLLLKQKSSKDDLSLKGGGEPAVTVPVVQTKVVAEKATPKQAATKTEKIVASVVQQEQSSPPPATKERSKKKRSELATLQQMSGDREGVNVSLLVPLVQKAELSRSEIQILIDLLLNKQQGSAVGNSEWIEGRQDPIVKLKKQLAEKEKALQEEQEASQSFQSKLKELRSEFNSERSRMTQNSRQLEESLAAKQTEMQALAARLQHALDNHVAEKRQSQQLQAQLNEEHLLLRKLQDEQGQAQSVLQQEFHNQRQQLEIHIAHLTETNQESDTSFKTQISQLHAQLQEQENINSSLSADLQKMKEAHGENKILRDQLTHCENQYRHLESQVAVLKESADRSQDLAHQNEELHRINKDLELHAANSSQHEATLQYEIDSLKEKCTNYNDLKNESNHLKSENDQLLTQVNKMSDLQLEIQHLLEVNEQLVTQTSSFSQLEEEAQQLREENESLAAQVTAMTERPAAEGRENGDIHYPEEKEAPVEEQHDKLVKEKEELLVQLNEELKQKDVLIEKLNSELITYKTEINKLNEDLESQRRKNNDLRTKNWKAMEALSVTEKSLESKVKESKTLVSEISKNTRTEEQVRTKELLQRLFPDIRIEENKVYEEWAERFESAALSLLSQHKTEDHSSMLIEVEKQNSQLQAMVTHYKTIIEETEGMLNKLQNHVEQEETKWRQQLQIKESELETLRRERDNMELQRVEEMQSQLQELQEKLHAVEEEREELIHKYEKVQSSCDRLQEQEREHLTLELKTEKEKNEDLSKEVVKLRSLVQIGQDSLNQEQQVVLQLQQQLDKLNGMNQNHNVATNGPASEASTTEAGSGKK